MFCFSAKKKRAVIRKYNMDGLSVSTDNLEMHPDPAPVLKSVVSQLAFIIRKAISTMFEHRSFQD